MSDRTILILGLICVLSYGLGIGLLLKQQKCEPWCRRYAPCQKCRGKEWRP